MLLFLNGKFKTSCAFRGWVSWNCYVLDWPHHIASHIVCVEIMVQGWVGSKFSLLAMLILAECWTWQPLSYLALQLWVVLAQDGAGCSLCLMFCSPSTPAACAPASSSALPCSAAWSTFPARVPKALSILAFLYWNTITCSRSCFSSNSRSNSLPTLTTSLPDCLCANGSAKREQRDGFALSGVAFLVPHSCSGMKLGLQL